MVVGHHQALRRNERRRAATQADDRVHGMGGQIRQAGRVGLHAHALEFLPQGRQLRGRPHALVRLRHDH